MSSADPTDPAAPPARDGGPATPDIPEELHGLWSSTPPLGWNGPIDDSAILAYVSREKASKDNLLRGGGLYGDVVLIGVHPRHRERADRLAEALRAVAADLDYLVNLWGDEALTRRIRERIKEALEGESVD